MKKVICLYRVSTNKQVNDEEDIPVQRETCRRYIERHNLEYGEEWEFYTEILEGGVSAYHKNIEQREIQQVIHIASQNPMERFVLLAFYSDRISRQDINGITFIDKLYKLGVEVWTVQEGMLKMDSETDRLMMFIKFWGNNNESRKTANRVDAARKVLTEAGVWTGGTVPYGYTLEPTGQLNKKGKMINALVKQSDEKAIVKEIFEKIVYGNYSLCALRDELNNRGIKTRKGCLWNISTIKSIINNPIYKGFIGYNKTSQMDGGRQKRNDRSKWILAKEKNEDYVMVSECDWESAQDILLRKSRAYHDNLKVTTDRTYKSQLLLSGLLICGHCGTTISPSVSSQWTSKKKEKRIHIEFYRCNLKTKGSKLCQGKTYISAKKLEKVVLEQINIYLDGLEQIDCAADVERMIKSDTADDEAMLKSMKKKYSETLNRKKALEEELIQSVLGNSALSKENINMALDSQKEEINKLETGIQEYEKKLEEKKLSMKEMKTLQAFVPVWRDVFDTAPLNIKKELLRLLIDKIVVKDYNVDIHFKITVGQFGDRICLHNKDTGQKNNSGRVQKGSAAAGLEGGEKYMSYYKDWDFYGDPYSSRGYCAFAGKVPVYDQPGRETAAAGEGGGSGAAEESAGMGASGCGKASGG